MPDKVAGVHTRKVTPEQQLDAALDGLAWLVLAMRTRLEPEPGEVPEGLGR